MSAHHVWFWTHGRRRGRIEGWISKDIGGSPSCNLFCRFTICNGPSSYCNSGLVIDAKMSSVLPTVPCSVTMQTYNSVSDLPSWEKTGRTRSFVAKLMPTRSTGTTPHVKFSHSRSGDIWRQTKAAKDCHHQTRSCDYRQAAIQTNKMPVKVEANKTTATVRQHPILDLLGLLLRTLPSIGKSPSTW